MPRRIPFQKSVKGMRKSAERLNQRQRAENEPGLVSICHFSGAATASCRAGTPLREASKSISVLHAGQRAARSASEIAESGSVAAQLVHWVFSSSPAGS